VLLCLISAALAAAEVALLSTCCLAVLSPVLTSLPGPPATVGELVLVTVGLAVAAELAVWAAVAVWVEVCCAIADAGRTKAPTPIAAARNFDLMLLRSPWLQVLALTGRGHCPSQRAIELGPRQSRRTADELGASPVRTERLSVSQGARAATKAAPIARG
jgi:hypothetical protein